jgi:actin-like ATPase involved in cell morphogenesis
VYVKGAGLVVDQPSVAAVNTRTGALIAVGEFAEKMTGRTPDYIRVVRPVTGGTVVDIEMAQRMLRQLIGDRTRRALRRRPRLRAAACTPHDRAERIPVGGEAVDAAIVQHLRHQHELMLPSQSVRPLQLALEGNGLTPQGPEVTEIHGRDVATGLARSVKVDTAAVRRAIQTPLTAVLDGIGKVLRDCPPDLVADLADRGIMMVGGSALLPGLDQMLRQATGMPVHIAEQPELCAVEGLGAMLEGRIAPMVLDPLSA